MTSIITIKGKKAIFTLLCEASQTLLFNEVNFPEK